MAKAAGVGVGTVSRVLNNHPSVRGETRERVLAIIEDLNYRPTPQARRTLPSEHPLIGVVTADLHSIWQSRVIQGIEAALSGQDFGLMAFALGTPERAAQLAQPGHPSTLAQGLLLCDDAAYRSWSTQEHGQPAVRVGTAVQDLDYVAVDNHYGGQIAGEYAATLPGEIVGVWLRGQQVPHERQTARKGFAEGVESAGRQIMQHIEIDPHDHLHRVAGELLDRLPQRATVMTYGDQLAVALMAEAQVRGRPVGGDLKIIGYGDHPQAALVGLTTVHQPLEEMAQRSTELLLGRIRERQEGAAAQAQQVQLLTPRLALRGSA
ncbi:transcriptional regulator [Deinococcus piscis]|uniref:Transcriptional regulator n=1 Tax=Deinococcus piscis TaxID=394230 RepID=A0ABQ3KF66_9DEIO|nr:transcriptional regulator [Deinococcus piscis]